MKRKLLITGASGFLGYHLVRVAAKDWEVYGIVNNGSIDYPGVESVQCDITDYIALGNCVDDIEPDAIIHAAALADANYCEKNKEHSLKVNVEASKSIAGIASDYQIPFVFTSTDLVFDGTKQMYREADEKNPINIYGGHKAMAEGEILKIYPVSGIFRLSLMFGYAKAGANNYMKKLVGQLGRGETATAFSDEYRSAAGAKSISEGIMLLLEKEAGVVHLGGPERLSRYELGEKIAAAYGMPKTNLKACLQKDMPMGAPRPADVSMDISKARSLGYSPLSADDELRLIVAGKYF